MKLKQISEENNMFSPSNTGSLESVIYLDDKTDKEIINLILSSDEFSNVKTIKPFIFNENNTSELETLLLDDNVSLNDEITLSLLSFIENRLILRLTKNSYKIIDIEGERFYSNKINEEYNELIKLQENKDYIVLQRKVEL